MNGRFRRACIRCAKRMGRRDNVKLAEDKSASEERGGFPCLHGHQLHAFSLGLLMPLPNEVC